MTAWRLWLEFAVRCWLRAPGTWLALMATVAPGIALIGFGLEPPWMALDELAWMGALAGILVGGLQLRKSEDLLVQADFEHRWLGPVSLLAVTGFLQHLATRVILWAASGPRFHHGAPSTDALLETHGNGWMETISRFGFASQLLTTSAIAACCLAFSRTRAGFTVSFLAIAWILPRLIGVGESGPHALLGNDLDRSLPVTMPGETTLELLQLPGRIVSALTPGGVDVQRSLAILFAWLAFAALLASRIEARSGTR